jgi:fatty acid desaturase
MNDELTRAEVFQRARALKSISTATPPLQITMHWLVIVLALGLVYLHPAVWVYALVIAFISARQYGLAILLHDAQHTLLHPSKQVNRWLATWLLAAPLGTDFDSSQKGHLDHHYHLGIRDQDPDYPLYCFGEPSPKRTPQQLIGAFVGKLLGLKILSMMDRSRVAVVETPAELRGGLLSSLAGTLWRLRRVVAVHLGFLVVLSWLFGWYGYFLLWALPLATLAALYNDLRIFCEHSLRGCEASAPEERLISYLSNPFERFFFAPNHMNYHAEHHLFPFVPHGRLPELRAAICACPEFKAQIEWRPGYVRHLIDYLAACRSAPALRRGDEVTGPGDSRS